MFLYVLELTVLHSNDWNGMFYITFRNGKSLYKVHDTFLKFLKDFMNAKALIK